MMIPRIKPELSDVRCFVCKRERWKIIEWREGLFHYYNSNAVRRYDIFKFNHRFDDWLDKPFMNQDRKITLENRDDRIRVLLVAL